MSETKPTVYESPDAWRAEATRLFGDDHMQWKFICPSCGRVIRIQDYKDAQAPQSAIAFSCVGRWLPERKEAFGNDGGPCNYAGGGLIGLNPVVVMDDGKELLRVFAFAGE